MLTEQIENYKKWCKENNLRPQDFTSLNAYKNRKDENLYRGQYEICVCEIDGAENILCMFDNAQQFARHLNLTMAQARDLLSKHFHKKVDRFLFRGAMTKLEFVNMMEE